MFRQDQQDYHKYSAILAATEPLRERCSDHISRVISPIKQFFGRISGKSLIDQGLEVRDKIPEVNEALTNLEDRMQKTIKSFDFTVPKFNAMSHFIQKTGSLKQKVLIQAYFYKIAADLNVNIGNTLPVIPLFRKKSTSTDRDYSNEFDLTPSTAELDESKPITDNDMVERFAKAASSVEMMKSKLIEQLKSELGVNHLPTEMMNPEYLPAMSPLVQRAATEFNTASADIVNRNGLEVGQFFGMKDKMNRSFLFRWKVKNAISKVQQSEL